MDSFGSIWLRRVSQAGGTAMLSRRLHPMRRSRLRTICLSWTLAGSLACSAAALTSIADAENANAADVLYRQGKQLAAEGRLAEAEVSLQQAVLLSPKNVALLTLLGKVKARLGEDSDAAILFRRVVEADPSSAEAHLNLAIALADAKDLPGALKEATRAERLAPGAAATHRNRARLLSDMARIPEAREEFATASRLDPQNAETSFLWGSFELNNHHAAAATPLLRKVISSQPNNFEAYFLLGKSLDLQEQPQEAIKMWRHAVAINPEDQEAVYALSQALRERDPAASAEFLARFKNLQAQKERLDQAKNLGNQAYAAMQVRDWSTAIAALGKALEICQSCALQADLYQHLGLAECHSGNLDVGEEHLKRALALKPDDTTTVQALTWVADQRKNNRTPQP
jgi:tetratricopeptide (TPR) repeat protein